MGDIAAEGGGVGAGGTEARAGIRAAGERLGDVRWVYEHYADERVVAGDAPSAGAWGLLQACRADSNAYFRVLDRVHPKDAGVVGEESAAALLDLEGRIQEEWRELAGVLELAVRRREFVEALVEFCGTWKRSHPAKLTEEQIRAIECKEGTAVQPGEVPA